MAAAGEGETDYDDQPDFSHLPDIVWVKILDFLDLPTRNKVSQTCHALHDAFYHPSLWHTVKISLEKCLQHDAEERESPHLLMTKNVGAYFRDVTLKVLGDVNKIPSHSEKVIQELVNRCHLERLTLDVALLRRKMRIVSHEVHLDVLVDLIATASQLKSLYLKEWPLYRGVQKVEILDALKANPKIKNLERLDLFWQSGGESTWETLHDQFPTPEATKSLVNHFTNLQHLSIRSSMLRQDIIEEMAKSCHVPLKRLAVLVTYSNNYPDKGIPEMSSSAWEKLHRHSPGLEVEFTIMTRMPFLDLAAFLKPEIPVSSLHFMKYSSLCTEDLESICDKYSKRLRKFISLVEEDDLDEPLKNLVSKSLNLTYLVFHGSLYQQTVLDLAAMKGTSWYQFDIPEKAMKFGWLPNGAEFDDDLVLVKTCEGEYQLAEMLKASREYNDEMDEGSKEQCWKDLITQISQLLGKPGLPGHVSGAPD